MIVSKFIRFSVLFTKCHILFFITIVYICKGFYIYSSGQCLQTIYLILEYILGMKSKYPGNLLPTNLRFWNFLFLIK